MALSPLLERVGFEDLPAWHEDDMAEAFVAFRRSALQALHKPYRSGTLGVEFEPFGNAYSEARSSPDLGNVARAFFERHFTPCRIQPTDAATGFVTGFYEPEAIASPVRTADFPVPLYRRPDDLVDVDDANRPASLEPHFAFGRSTPDGIVEYFDRATVEQGALAGRGLEIAWLADPVDVFFIHVQGAARLKVTDGRSLRVTYAAKSGHRFTGPGHVLVELGEIPRDKVTMQSIRAWFRDNPHRVNEILRKNRSIIFFREAPVDDPALGPIAAAKVPLTAGRSLAVDRLLHTFGTPFFIDAPSLTVVGGKPFRRLMIAQDTGSAIVGPARGDIFVGSGDAAGEIAGVVRHSADFYVLVPKALLGG